MQHILIIEDEHAIQEFLKAFLEDAGYEVTIASDGVEGIDQYHQRNYDLILLDVMLPKLDGYQVCELIRRESRIPIIFLTALDAEINQIKGYDLQADDYITKPFSMPLLVKKVSAVLRRASTRNKEDIISYEGITMDIQAHEVNVQGKEVLLTSKEFDLLRTFLGNKGKVFTREVLLDKIWGYDYYGDAKIVNTHIKNIRKKLGTDCIKTIRGVGYKIV